MGVVHCGKGSIHHSLHGWSKPKLEFIDHANNTMFLEVYESCGIVVYAVFLMYYLSVFFSCRLAAVIIGYENHRECSVFPPFFNHFFRLKFFFIFPFSPPSLFFSFLDD